MPVNYNIAEDITASDSTEYDDLVGVHVKTASGLVELEYSQKADDGSAKAEGVYILLGDSHVVPGGIRKVKSTGTAATGLVGLFQRRPS